jgi:hypothetical protein
VAFPRIQRWRTLLIAIFISQIAFTSNAFSLLGPLAPWMSPTVGFINDPRYDVGGPRDLNDEFRWNLPLLTYGFSDDFKNFFGPQGVAEVEAAVAVLNNLPPVSQLDLSTAPTATARLHLAAARRGLYDLRSIALGYLLEQMGLAAPARCVWVNSDPNAPIRTHEFDSFPNDYILRRNFDPITLSASSYINGIRFTYSINPAASGGLYPDDLRFALPVIVDQTQVPYYNSVADNPFSAFGHSLDTGRYTPALTRDDLGGLRYLLHTNNVNVEPLAPGVRAHDLSTALVNTAQRPGIDHIQFQRFDPGSSALTNVFADKYFAGGILKTQTVERVIAKPDILFTVENIEPVVPNWGVFASRIGPNFSHTETNGTGILLPGAVISLQKLGDVSRDPFYYNPQSGEFFDEYWGSFNGLSSNTTVYPQGDAYQTGRTIAARPVVTDAGRYGIQWTLRLIAGEKYAIDDSLNLTNWTFVTYLTAQAIHTITNAVTWNPPHFFRIRRVQSQ